MRYSRFSAAEQSEVWDRWDQGEAMNVIARSIGRSQGAVHEDRRRPTADADGVV